MMLLEDIQILAGAVGVVIGMVVAMAGYWVAEAVRVRRVLEMGVLCHREPRPNVSRAGRA